MFLAKVASKKALTEVGSTVAKTKAVVVPFLISWFRKKSAFSLA
jgi:hypothetical protein